MKKLAPKITASLFTAVTAVMLFASPVHAQDQGSVIQIGTIDNLLWSIVKTIQFYALPVGAVVIAGLGIKMLTSGDDTGAKENMKSWMVKVGIGMAIIFGATTIATVLKSSVGG